MLTKDLLLHRTKARRIRPTFVDVNDKGLMALSADLVRIAERAVGEKRKDLDEALKARASGHPQPKVSKGLVKLITDRMEFEEPGEDAAQLRSQVFEASVKVLRGLTGEVVFADYEAAMSAALSGADLGEVRAGLHADLAEYRTLLSFKAISAKGLLERYNVAQAQGLLIYADSVTLTLRSPQLLEVRRLLRWLKFCRLVAQLHQKKKDWVLEVEGPGAILSMQKKYGLQLAQFFSAVPLLSRFELKAEVTLPRRKPVMLKLDEGEGLVSPHKGAPGYMPEEIALFTEKFKEPEWRVDLVPEVRHVGAAGISVPDLLLHHDKRGVTVAIELFHQWHKGLLERRLVELGQKADPYLFLGVDRGLAKAAGVEEGGQVFWFNRFPSERAVRKILGRFVVGDGDLPLEVS